MLTKCHPDKTSSWRNVCWPVNVETKLSPHIYTIAFFLHRYCRKLFPQFNNISRNFFHTDIARSLFNRYCRKLFPYRYCKITKEMELVNVSPFKLADIDHSSNYARRERKKNRKGQKKVGEWGRKGMKETRSAGEMDLVDVSPIARRVARAGKYSNGSLLYIYLPRNGLINVRLYICAICLSNFFWTTRKNGEQIKKDDYVGDCTRDVWLKWLIGTLSTVVVCQCCGALAS